MFTQIGDFFKNYYRFWNCNFEENENKDKKFDRKEFFNKYVYSKDYSYMGKQFMNNKFRFTYLEPSTHIINHFHRYKSIHENDIYKEYPYLFVNEETIWEDKPIWQWLYENIGDIYKTMFDDFVKYVLDEDKEQEVNNIIGFIRIVNNHLTYKGFLKTLYWFIISISYKRMAKCKQCGGKDKLQIHHKSNTKGLEIIYLVRDYLEVKESYILNKLSSIPLYTSDFNILCKECHFKLHKKQEQENN